MRAIFGPFSFDLRTLELTREGISLRIEEKPARLLLRLIERRGEIVSREELRTRLWPEDVNLDFDHGLNKAANKLRAVLGDQAVKPKYIETLSRRGYKFVHPLELIPDVQPGLSPAEQLNPSIAQRDEVLLPKATLSTPPVEGRADHGRRSKFHVWLLLVAAMAAIVAFFPAADLRGHLTRFRRTDSKHIVLPTGLQPIIVGDGSLALSPDGMQVAFAAVAADRQPRLWLVDLNTSRGRELPGTEGGYMPFWSPDGRHLGFFTVFALKTIDLASYAIRELTPVSFARGGSWSSDGVILFAPGTRSPIFRIPADGGTAAPLTAVNAKSGASTDRWPRFLPDGNHFIFVEAKHDMPDAPGRVMLGSLDGGDPQFLLESDSNAIAGQDSIAFVSHGKLLAVRLRLQNPIDLASSKILADGVDCDRGSWNCAFDFNRNGAVYRPRTAAADRESIAWFGTSGNKLASLGPPGVYRSVNLSPDGKSVSVTCGDPDQKTCLLRADGTVTRLDSEGLVSGTVWSPNSSAVAYLDHQSDSQFLLKIKPVHESRAPQTVFSSKTEIWPLAWHPSGRYILFDRTLPSGKYDARLLDLKTGETMPYLTEAATPVDLARFSRDGRWVSFSQQTGSLMQLYVASWPTPSKVIQLTTEGGCAPKWRGDGRAIYYLGPGGNLYAVSLAPSQNGFRIGNPVPLFRPPIFYAPFDRVSFDVSSRGDRFVITTVEFPKVQELISISF